MPEPSLVLLPNGQRVLAERSLALPQGDTIQNFQFGIDLPVQLAVGTPRPRSPLGDLLYRPVSSRTIDFSYATFGMESFVQKSAKRAMRAKFQSSERRIDKVSASLARFGWKTMLDRDELRNADIAEGFIGLPLGIREMHQRHAREIVLLSKEVDRANTALAAASYSQSTPDLDVTLAGGSEWDAAGGDSYDDIRTLAETLAAGNAAQIDDVDVYLTHASAFAAYNDPTFKALRATAGRVDAPTAAELRAYWGVGNVFIGDSYFSTDQVNLTSLYGDVAILRISRTPAELDATEGQLDSFVRFYWTDFGPDGRPLEAVWDGDRTSWSFPWEAWELPTTVNTRAAAIIRNTHA